MPSIINSDDGVVSGTSGLKTTGGNDGALNIQTNGSNAISISSGQRSTFPTTIGVGGATPSTSGSGISFPATQSASSDANTLDDYEEGTFTPTIAFGGGTTGITYSTQSGTYTKIGNVVWITLNVTLSNKGSSSGAMQILGLPFSMSATVIPSMRIQGTTFGGQYTAVSQTTQFELQETSEAGTLSTITNSDATNSSQINLTCVHNV